MRENVIALRVDPRLSDVRVSTMYVVRGAEQQTLAHNALSVTLGLKNQELQSF